MGKKRAERNIFEIHVTETRKPQRVRRIEIPTEASLQQLHLAILAAWDYPAPYTTADRDFCFDFSGATCAYGADALKPLSDLVGEGMNGKYVCGIARLRAVLAIRSESRRVPRSRYPLVYEENAAAPHRHGSDNARYGVSCRYLKHEARPDSAAFRHGLYAGVIAGPPSPPSACLKWILPHEPLASRHELNALLAERMSEHNAVAHALSEDRDAYVADFIARFANRDALLDWTFGFVFAMSLTMDDWQSAIAQNDTWAGSFEPIAMMMNFADDPTRWTWLDDGALQKNIARAVAMATVLMWDLWREKLFPQPVRRASPKPGSNQPCPCGSGKKSKRCCASPLRAV